jgi:hypothetical protein
VSGSLVRDVTDTGGGGHGYGVALSYTQGAVVRDNVFRCLLRHGVTVSWGSRESLVLGNDFDRSAGDANNFASVDIHGQDDYANLVQGNRIVGCGQEGIIVGGGGSSHGNDGPWNVVRGNHVEGCLYGIPVYKMTWDRSSRATPSSAPACTASA